MRTRVEVEAGGVFDYLAKPIELNHLLEVMENAARSLQHEERRVTDAAAGGRNGWHNAGHGRVL